MTQQQNKVTITTYQGFSVVADDAVQFGVGSGAYGAIQAARDVTIASADGLTITYIPYKAIDHAIIEKSNVTVADPVDANCP